MENEKNEHVQKKPKKLGVCNSVRILNFRIKALSTTTCKSFNISCLFVTSMKNDIEAGTFSDEARLNMEQLQISAVA